jgi:DNA-binding response OmpR family regulator
MKKIIFADDDPTIQDVINLIFEGEYEVTVFSNGEPILKNQFELPDLFLLDKQLSGMDGLDICRFLKGQESTKNVPVIIISANPKIFELAKSAGADAAIEKPFPIKELRDLIELHLRRAARN